jgi:hypothetical protein
MKPLANTRSTTPYSDESDEGAIITWPWLQERVGEYRANLQKSRRPRLTLPVLIALAGLVILISVSLGLERASYPQDLDDERALRICSQADPAFVRFLASEREACYGRIRGLAARAATLNVGTIKP